MSFATNFSSKYRRQLLDTGLDALKAASKKVAHKTGEYIGNKIGNSENKACTCWKFKKCWRNHYSIRKKRRNIKQIKTSIINMEHYEIPKLLTD